MTERTYKGVEMTAGRKREVKRGNWCRRSTLPGGKPRIREHVEDEEEKKDAVRE
jgi:hypothetical protein